jgi:deazaflavin-dependent oxidoreductase (nitroreductase family)
MGTVPALDPAFPKGRLYRGSERFAQTAAGRWLAINVAPKVDPLLLRLTGGRTGSFPQGKVVLLTVPGRRSGEPRTTPLLYYTEGDDVIVIASSYGRDKHPGWYHNLIAHPECELRVGRHGGRHRAQEVTDEAERRRLYDRAHALYSGYEGYEERAGAGGRRIPVLRLTPLEP